MIWLTTSLGPPASRSPFPCPGLTEVRTGQRRCAWLHVFTGGGGRKAPRRRAVHGSSVRRSVPQPCASGVMPACRSWGYDWELVGNTRNAIPSAAKNLFHSNDVSDSQLRSESRSSDVSSSTGTTATTGFTVSRTSAGKHHWTCRCCRGCRPHEGPKPRRQPTRRRATTVPSRQTSIRRHVSTARLVRFRSRPSHRSVELSKTIEDRVKCQDHEYCEPASEIVTAQCEH